MCTVSLLCKSYGEVAVTKELTATTKVVLAATVSTIVWGISLCLVWEKFLYIEFIGFLIMMAGICGYGYNVNDE